MIIKNYKYINLAYTAGFLIFLACVCIPIFLKLGIFVTGIWFIFSFFITFSSDICEKTIQKELNKRMSKIPVPKNQIFKWRRNRNIGYAFTDLSKGTIWICSTQTKFELHIYFLSELKIVDESFGKIYFKRTSNTMRENELREFIIYHY